MAATGVQVTRTDDTVKLYPAGRSFDFDGYGDLIVRDASGAAIATRKRGTWLEIEVVDDSDDGPGATTPTA